MNAIEKLLKLDSNKIQLPTKEVEIPRLSKLLGEQFVFKLQAVSASDTESIREMAIKNDNVDIFEIRKGIILAGVKEPNLRDESLRTHFGAVTPYDLLDKLFLAGEKEAIYEEINKLSGYDEGSVTEVKSEVKN
jgi:hypothetical protein